MTRPESLPIETVADLERKFHVTKSSLVASIAEEGMREPIVINRKNDELLSIDDGNHRLQAARILGWKTVPVVYRER